MNPLRWIKSHPNETVLFAILLISYVYFFPRWADPNQNSRLDMVVAVVEDGTFQIDPYVANTVDYAKVGDHYYSDKAPGAALVGIPVYAGLRLVFNLPVVVPLMDRLANNQAFQSTLREGGSGIFEQKVRFALAQVAVTLVVAVLPSAVLGVLMYRFLAQFTSGVAARWAVVLGYGLLTPAFAYAGAFYGHQLSAVLLFGAFYWLFAGQKPLSVWSLFAVGLLLGYSVISEYPSALVVGILCVYALHGLHRQGSWTRMGWMIVALIVCALAQMRYNTVVFGGPLKLGYSNSELWITQHHTGFMSLTLPHADALWGITFGVFRGLFVLSPWLLLSMPGAVLWWRSGQHRTEFWVVVTSVVAMFLFNSSSIMWWGGFAVGPRYLLPMLPLMAMPIIYVLREWGTRTWLKMLMIALSGWSLVATWGLTLAGQGFPPDTLFNPLTEYAWPNWQTGNIARNVGTVMGLRGLWSLVPLLTALAGLVAARWLLNRWNTSDLACEPQQVKSPGPLQTRNNRQSIP